MTHTKGNPARGFSLIELLTVMVLIAILAAIALPRLRGAIYNAQCTGILGDVHAVQVAYSHYISDGGRRPGNSSWGSVATDLAPYLPDGFNFATDIADYRWVRLAPGASPWGVEMGELRVRPKPDLAKVLVDRLAGMSNQAMIVKQIDQVSFYMVP